MRRGAQLVARADPFALRAPGRHSFALCVSETAPIAMKKLLASLFALTGAALGAQAQQKPQVIDPKSILFTTPTLSDDVAPLVPATGQPSVGELVFHEDDWSQVEFFPKTQLSNIQRLLTEYKGFEQAQRVKHGWKNVYVRKIQRVPVLAGARPVAQLEAVLGAKAGAAPLLLSSGAVSGRVKDGFSLPLGGNVTLYGYVAGDGVPVLGASIGSNPDDMKLTQAFTKLSASHSLVLVDWRAQLVLVSVGKDGRIEAWRP
ncbi:MAG TPA: hypothetical protein VN277_06245 [Acidiferrobacterales bacterium]|nr:hypothetical protein [Acidiferrobacterales bacterium]